MNNIKVLEDSLLQAIDTVAEQSKDKATKILADLFKSAILKKYKDAFDEELPLGKVHKETVEKAVDFYFADACVSYRMLPALTDDEKERDIKIAKNNLGFIKQATYNILVSKNVEIIQ